MHKGKQALERIKAFRRPHIDLPTPMELSDIILYVAELEEKAHNWDAHVAAEKAVLADAIAHPERHRIIGPAEIRNEALDDAAQVVDTYEAAAGQSHLHDAVHMLKAAAAAIRALKT